MTANLQARDLRSITNDERRVCQAPRRLEDRQLQKLGALAHGIIELDSRAIFVLDGQGNIVASNTIAERLCRTDGWVQNQRGRLAFAQPVLQSWLHTAMGSAERRASTSSGSGEGRTFLRLRHLAHRAAQGGDDPAEDLFVLTIGESTPSVVTKEDLRAAFGLTGAEAAVAAELYSGKSLARVAETLNLSVNTVKTHVKRVFRKCDVRSHVQLVKRIDAIG